MSNPVPMKAILAVTIEDFAKDHAGLGMDGCAYDALAEVVLGEICTEMQRELLTLDEVREELKGYGKIGTIEQLNRTLQTVAEAQLQKILTRLKENWSDE